MSSTDLEGAIETLRTDPRLVQAVAEQGPSALQDFDLTEPDQAAIVDAVRRDIEDATDDVVGFAAPLPPAGPVPIPMPNLAMFAGLHGLTFHDISITKPVDKSSPTL